MYAFCSTRKHFQIEGVFPFIFVRCFPWENFEEAQHRPEPSLLKVDNYPHVLIPPPSTSPLKRKKGEREEETPNDKEKKRGAVGERDFQKLLAVAKQLRADVKEQRDRPSRTSWVRQAPKKGTV